MEASLAHKKAIAISFPFNGWGSWTENDIQTAVQVTRYSPVCHSYIQPMGFTTTHSHLLLL